MKSAIVRAAWLATVSASAMILMPAASAFAASDVAVQHDSKSTDLQRLKLELDTYRKQVREQQELVTHQEAALRALEDSLKQQAARIRALEAEQGKSRGAQNPTESATPSSKPVVAEGGGAAAAPSSSQSNVSVAQETGPQAKEPAQSGRKPVGQAPGQEPRPQVVALSDLGGVLTPKGTLSLEPSLEFDHVSTNQLLFRGISIVQGLLIGVIDASDVRGDTTIATLTGRVGLTNRLELEAKVPYLYRQNRETDIPSTSNAHPFQSNTSGYGIGDVELAAHYQFNSGTEDWPIFVGNLRYKSDTGKGPFDVAFDQANGAPLALPTGSGFNAIEPSLTVIYPSDPVVFFGSLEYDYSFAKNFNKTVSQTCGPQNNQACTIGEVTPGQSFGVTLGMAIALNEQTSLTLGYQHYYIGGTQVVLSGQPTKTNALQAGSLIVGASYQFNPRVGVNFTTQIGATRDTPDVRVMFRVPISIDVAN